MTYQWVSFLYEWLLAPVNVSCWSTDLDQENSTRKEIKIIIWKRRWLGGGGGGEGGSGNMFLKGFIV